MSQKRPLVIVTRKLPESVQARLMELFDSRLNLDDRPMSAEQLKAAMASAEILVPTVTDRVDKAVIDAAGPNLKLIANFGAGTDHIDPKAAHARGLLVTNTPGVLTEDTADITLALILAAARGVGAGERAVRAGKWTGWAPTSMLGLKIGGKRLGIVGMGRIGAAVARRARGFGMSIHYHNRRRVEAALESELEATWWENLDQMLGHTDIISLNCPRTPETYHLMSAARLRLMKPHAVLVNTSRGDVIDEAALLAALQARQIGAAGLDVYAQEPKIDPKFFELDNVVLLPHLGSATLEGRIAMGEKVLINIRAFVDGHKPPDRVLPAGL